MIHQARIAVLASSLLAAATAQAISIDALDAGWYAIDSNFSDTATHFPSNLNYFVGRGAGLTSPDPDDGSAVYRNFFVFDLASLGGIPITSAILHLANPGLDDPSVPDFFQGFRSPDPFETYELSDVTTNLDDLIAGRGGTAAFDDLGNGTSFGNYQASRADNGRFIDVTLNAAAVQAIQQSAGGLFALGGRVSSLSDLLVPQFIFGFSGLSIEPGSDTQLLINTVSIPEPDSNLLFGVGALAALFYRILIGRQSIPSAEPQTSTRRSCTPAQS
jgi:hypothetical protein